MVRKKSKMDGQHYQGNETKTDKQVEDKTETCCISKYMDFVFVRLGICLILTY